MNYLTNIEREKIREYTAALLAFMSSMNLEQQIEAYDYVILLVELVLERANKIKYG